MTPECNEEDCSKFGVEMDFDTTDSRPEWTEHIFVCSECKKIRIIRSEYGQESLVEIDRIIDGGFMA